MQRTLQFYVLFYIYLQNLLIGANEECGADEAISIVLLSCTVKFILFTKLFDNSTISSRLQDIHFLLDIN